MRDGDARQPGKPQSRRTYLILRALATVEEPPVRPHVYGGGAQVPPERGNGARCAQHKDVRIVERGCVHASERLDLLLQLLLAVERCVPALLRDQGFVRAPLHDTPLV